jgi:hypothetical protein
MAHVVELDAVVAFGGALDSGVEEEAGPMVGIVAALDRTLDRVCPCKGQVNLSDFMNDCRMGVSRVRMVATDSCREYGCGCTTRRCSSRRDTDDTKA